MDFLFYLCGQLVKRASRSLFILYLSILYLFIFIISIQEVIMTYQQFLTEIQTQLNPLLHSDVTIQLQKIRKNNGITLDGLTILQKGCNISPTIYLNDYYKEYQAGTSLSHILLHIKEIYQTYRPNHSIDVTFFTDFENVRHRILFKLIHYQKNEELLKEIPHFRYLDFAVVFYCLLSTSAQGNATILIRSTHLSYWNISADDLYSCALENTPAQLPADFEPLMPLLHKLMPLPFPADIMEEESETPLYVLTNKAKLYGASCILYPNLLDSIADKLACDLYLIPSSIHEFLILPALPETCIQDLNAMIHEVNSTQVEEEEILSDHAYFYSRTDKLLTSVSEESSTI